MLEAKSLFKFYCKQLKIKNLFCANHLQKGSLCVCGVCVYVCINQGQAKIETSGFWV